MSIFCFGSGPPNSMPSSRGLRYSSSDVIGLLISMGTPRFAFGSCTDSVEATKPKKRQLLDLRLFSNQCESFGFLAEGVSDQAEVCV